MKDFTVSDDGFLEWLRQLQRYYDNFRTAQTKGIGETE